MTRSSNLAVVLLTIHASWPTAAEPQESSSKLQIHIPSSLRANYDGYRHQEALFGNPPYGGSIIQQLFYADSDLCSSFVDTSAGYPRRPWDDETEKMSPWEAPFLLMADRGGCTFVTKVRHAQHVGAAGVIIADDTCLCEFKNVCESDVGQVCEDREPIMADDGSGQDITIPSFLMLKQDADIIKEALMADTFVQMEMSWNLAKQEVVEFSMWTAAGDPLARSLEEYFGDAVALFGSRARFTPHFTIRSGYGCVTGCSNDCTNGARYCASDPDGDMDRGVSGSDIVEESLRRICIWKLYGRDGVGLSWWRYVSSFARKCGGNGDNYGILFNDKGCVDSAMEDAEVNGENVNKCMKDSGGLESNRPNVWLDEEINVKNKYGVVTSPVMFVNGKVLRGRLTFDVAFEAICAGFTDGDAPDVCAKCDFCPKGAHACIQSGGVCDAGDSVDYLDGGIRDEAVDEEQPMDDDYWFDVPTALEPPPVDSHPHKDRSHLLAVFGILGVVAVFGLGAFVHYKRSRRQVRDQVRGILGEYMQVNSLAVEESPASAGTYSPAPYIPFDYEKMDEANNSQME